MRAGLILFFVIVFYVPAAWAISPGVFSDWKNPTVQDLQIAQSILDSRTSEEIVGENGALRATRLRFFKIFRPSCTNYDLQIDRGEDPSTCVISYVSFGSLYESLLKRLIKSLRDQGFTGDILYRVGGWPNLQNGGILLCDVAYAFKISAFEEAMQLGYTHALWLDSRVVPLTDLSEVFARIRKNDLYFRESNHSFEKILKTSKKLNSPNAAEVLGALGVSREELKGIKHCSTGALGLNLSHPDVKQLLAGWHAYAEEKVPFQTGFPEQIPFSVLVDRHNLHRGFCERETMVFHRSDIQPSTNFLVEY